MQVVADGVAILSLSIRLLPFFPDTYIMTAHNTGPFYVHTAVANDAVLALQYYSDPLPFPRT